MKSEKEMEKAKKGQIKTKNESRLFEQGKKLNIQSIYFHSEY